MSLRKGIGSFLEGIVLGIGYVIASPFLLIGWIYDEIFPDKERTGIAILGMIGSGKTTIFNYLRNENSGPGTSIRDLNEFEYNLDNGKTRIIKKGIDIGGGEEYIKKMYTSMLQDEKYDVFFFTFNSFEYVNNLDYEREVNQRLYFIDAKNTSKKKIILIGSYMDKFKNNSEISESIKAKTKNKEISYKHFFNESLVAMDLTNKSALKDFFNQKVFK